MITEVLRYVIAIADGPAFLAAYEKAAALLRASPHCLGFELLHGADEPENWLLTIRWTSSDGHLKGIRTSPEFPAFFALMKPFYGQLREMKHYAGTAVNWSPAE